LFLWHVFSMVCVTPPVEVSPKEARHTSIQTHAFWNGIIISLSADGPSCPAKLEKCLRHFPEKRLILSTLHIGMLLQFEQDALYIMHIVISPQRRSSHYLCSNRRKTTPQRAFIITIWAL
jgi:hypothetical protein